MIPVCGKGRPLLIGEMGVSRWREGRECIVVPCLHKDHTEKRDSKQIVNLLCIGNDLIIVSCSPAKNCRAGMDGCRVTDFLVAEGVLAHVGNMFDNLFCMRGILHYSIV